MQAKGAFPMSMQMTNDRYGHLRHISALGLAVYDTRLYLDIHDCPEARQYLEQRKAEYDEAVLEYEAIYGKITPMGHPCGDVHWAWQID